ncbi:MAG: HNH endonuclease [Chloroflexi bacterium]|nr:HNH endonuclease [Chloroflexota bacterium]
MLFGQREGWCNGCRSEFPFRNLTIDHIIPESRGGTNHIENPQLLCWHRSSVKGNRLQEYLVARLRELGIAT